MIFQESEQFLDQSEASQGSGLTMPLYCTTDPLFRVSGRTPFREGICKRRSSEVAYFSVTRVLPGTVREREPEKGGLPGDV